MHTRNGLHQHPSGAQTFVLAAPTWPYKAYQTLQTAAACLTLHSWLATDLTHAGS